MSVITILLTINSALLLISGFFIKMWVSDIKRDINILFEKVDKVGRELSYLEGKNDISSSFISDNRDK